MTRFDPVFASKALWQIRIKKRPFVLSHGVNANCNMRCKFCEYWKETGKEPSRDEVFRLLDDAKKFGIGVYNAWTTEPLLRKDLPLIMAHAKKLGLVTSMVTNGKLLYERVEELEDVDFLSVSVDGVESYKEIRRMDFETLLKGLKKAIEVRKLQKQKNPILMNCVLTGKNLDDIETLILLAKKLGVKISFEPVHEFPGIDEEIWSEIGIRDKEKFRRVVDRIIELKKEGYPIINSKTYLSMVRDGNMDYKCRASSVIINLTHDGTAETCRVQHEPLGNVMKDGFEKVWNNSAERRKEIVENCEGCLFFGYTENSLMQGFNPEVLMHYEWM
ncbi:radical SAM protein [Methanosarcina acetivorans]|uniref:Coenzyme PQQ synthesis protein E n=1 Tax=Methanosarcina acetivorans (strain ATCC 35395 / DSM 2834 / JCM 12185 / C2A) TaxID=188937 RepID=Q8TI77_METAC|nr:radical SAM protein [Methanosarcina acetivorans]AAM07623.1 coenzyme PQQ synthesis protein E [Methanosarcina acetivorans C2A]